MPCGKLCWRQSVPKGRTSTPSANGPPLPDDGRAGGYHHQCGDKATVHHGGPLRRAWAESRLQRRGDRGGHASGEGISAGHVATELNPCAAQQPPAVLRCAILSVESMGGTGR